MQNDIGRLMKAAKKASVPIVSIDTFDPSQTMAVVAKAMNGKEDPALWLVWDICRSLKSYPFHPKCAEADALITDIAEGQDPNLIFTNPTEMLIALMRVPKDQQVRVFMLNAHRFLQNESVSQGVWNLRDVFKVTGSMLILLSPGLSLPDELKQDVMCLSEELPNKEQIGEIVDKIIKAASGEGANLTLDENQRGKVCETLTGMTAFACEQQLAMCLKKDGVDMNQLWERKRRAVEQTPGLQLYRDGGRFNDLGGCDNIKSYLRRVMTGRRPVSAILWIDEIEKSLAGAGGGDLSGTSADQLGVLLREMQDYDLPGILFLGHPGTAKSAITKAIGPEYEVPVVSADMGAAKGKFVGESEQKIRAMMKIFRAIADGRGMVVATCNQIAALPPELRRRFRRGTFMFDLPTKEERAKIWPIYVKKYSLGPEDAKIEFNDEGWTGAEISAVCETAWATQMTVTEASKYIVPVCRSAPEAIEKLRNLAHGRFISAGESGIYSKPSNKVETVRKVQV